MFKEVDHIAIVVRDTKDALNFYRDQMGLPELYSETLDEVGVRLTHLDMGNVRLQLVQPLRPDHPLSKHLDEHGEGFHHVCWKVDAIEGAMERLTTHGLQPKPDEPHPAPNGGKAAFIEPSQTARRPLGDDRKQVGARSTIRRTQFTRLSLQALRSVRRFE